MDYIKYPRTYHLPYSETLSADDKRLDSDEQFKRMKLVYCTEKMDGENTTIYSNGYIHARSIDGNKHSWQSWLKNYIKTWCFNIPNGWRICGENLYAKHSIGYIFPDETYYFQVFGIYNENNERISYKEMIEWCSLLGIHFVPTFYVGVYDKNLIMQSFSELKTSNLDNLNNETEGFVVSNCNLFKYEDFSKNVGKYVRANHVQTSEHWTTNWSANIVRN